MATVSYHSKDWCHLFGKRPDHLADIFYPENAEHAPVKHLLVEFFSHKNRDTKYIRICLGCAKTIVAAIEKRCP